MLQAATRNTTSLETGFLKRDLTGRKFGRLFVVSFSHTRDGAGVWVCACVTIKEIIGKIWLGEMQMAGKPKTTNSHDDMTIPQLQSEIGRLQSILLYKNCR
jgi:hypothetical protein